MSSGHHLKHSLTQSELDDLLDHALADRRVRRELAKPRRVVTTKDVPLLGSSSVGWDIIFLDQHLRHGNWPYGVLPVQGRRLDVKPGLVRHESLEPILENIFGWPYGTLAHPVAEHYEERLYREKGFDPREVAKAFAPYIRNDEREPLPLVPVSLDLRPEMGDDKLMARIRKAQDAQKSTQASHGYVARSVRPNQNCSSCVKFVKQEFGGPACLKVAEPINAAGWCRKFVRGALDRHGASGL